MWEWVSTQETSSSSSSRTRKCEMSNAKCKNSKKNFVWITRLYLRKRLLTGTLLVNNSLLTGTVPVNISLLTETVLVNNTLLTQTVPVNNFLLTQILLVNKTVLTGTIRVNNPTERSCSVKWFPIDLILSYHELDYLVVCKGASVHVCKYIQVF